MDASEALKLLRESAAQITEEEAQETISATAQAKPQKRAFTEYTWDLRDGPPARPFKTHKDGTIDMNALLEDGLKAKAKLRRSPLFPCCVVGNCPEPLCSG